MIYLNTLTCTTFYFFFFSSRRRHTRFDCDWSSDVCSSDLVARGRHRMLDLELGVELGALVERVTEPEHAGREVRLAAPAIARRIREIHLAIAPESRTLPCGRPRQRARRGRKGSRGFGSADGN